MNKTKMKPVYYIFALFMFCSCKESDKDRITRLVKEWKGKELVFPGNRVFTRYGVDTLDDQIPDTNWKVVSYIDSVGCISCKLQFYRWQGIMYEQELNLCNSQNKIVDSQYRKKFSICELGKNKFI
jgi:hypothetical protein